MASRSLPKVHCDHDHLAQKIEGVRYAFRSRGRRPIRQSTNAAVAPRDAEVFPRIGFDYRHSQARRVKTGL